MRAVSIDLSPTFLAKLSFSSVAGAAGHRVQICAATTTGPSRYWKKQRGWAALLIGHCNALRDGALSWRRRGRVPRAGRAATRR